MFSYLLVALFALLSLPVSSHPLRHSLSSLPSSDLSTPSVTPNATASIYPSLTPTTDYCSEPTSSAPAPPSTSAPPTTSVPSTTPAPPTTTSPSTTTAPPTTPAPLTTSPSTTPAPPSTSVPSTSAPASTSAALTTVSDTSVAVNTGGYATYFYQNGNAGACGQVNSDSAFICAMDQALFGTSGPSSPLCGKQVQITNANTGSSITVTVADDCPTCNNQNSIDLSVAAFQALAPLSEGIFPIKWSYV